MQNQLWEKRIKIYEHWNTGISKVPGNKSLLLKGYCLRKTVKVSFT
jgi:hypothetical protein